MTGRDIIPDIHADSLRLDRTLAALGPDRPLGFLGDFIDAGRVAEVADDRAVLERVRGLIDSGRAVAVMGNHELNAILFHRDGPDGAPLRSRGEKNQRQHRSFLDAFGTATGEALDWTDWFLTLPLWRDLGGLRLVHACWDDAAIATVAARRPDAMLRPEDLPEVAAEDTPFGRAVKTLLTGREIPLPEGHGFTDEAGHERHVARLAWWRHAPATWREAQR